MGAQIQLSRNIFKILHDECLLMVSKADVLDEATNVNQRYGFGTFLKEKISLKSLVDNNQEVKNAFEVRDTARSIDGKYLYDRYRDYKKDESLITLKGYHSWVYFVFLGYKNCKDFLDSQLKNGKISPDDFNHQLYILEQGVPMQGDGIFGCYHYSKLWQGIYAFQVTIKYSTQVLKNGIPTYDVTARSSMPDEEKPVEYKGKARHERSNLFIDLQPLGAGGQKRLVFSMERKPSSIPSDRVFIGSYLGVSRNTDIISGEVCLTKLNEGENAIDIPLHIKRFLHLEESQVRTKLNPMGYQLRQLPSKRDEENFLNKLVGKYRFCWLDSSSRLIESEFEIHNNFDASLRTFLSEEGEYTGRLKFFRDTLCLENISLRENSLGKRLSASVFFFAKHVLRQDEKPYIEGVYILSGVTTQPKHGSCLIEKVEPDGIINPEIHSLIPIELEKIYDRLIEKQFEDWKRSIKKTENPDTLKKFQLELKRLLKDLDEKTNGEDKTP